MWFTPIPGQLHHLAAVITLQDLILLRLSDLAPGNIWNARLQRATLLLSSLTLTLLKVLIMLSIFM